MPKSPTVARKPVRVAAIALSSVAALALLVGLSPTRAVDAQQTPAGAVQAWPGYADLVEQIMPSVVSVTVSRNVERNLVEAPMHPNAPGQFEGPEELQRFMERFFDGRGFGPQMPAPGAAPVAAGSGFIIDQSGLIVTNHHVIANANEITVFLNDGREYPATLLGSDPDTDLALLEIDADEDLAVARFANSDQVRVGDAVLAIGNPFGLGGTVTAGIVSAQSRVIGAGRYDDFLQIDAPINRGNSGGPTFNLAGEVIGVNTAIHSPTGGNVGIGFAIPANLALDVIDDLRDDGLVERGWLGVHIQGVDPDLAEALGLDDAAGALVSQVTPDSPAAAAGFQKGDVILEFAGAPITTLRDLTRKVADSDPGSDADATVWRNGERVTVPVALGRMPTGDTEVAALAPEVTEPDASAPRLGVALAELNAQTREAFNLAPEVDGVVVMEVQPDSPAAAKGLQRGDVIIEAGREAVRDPSMVAEAVRVASERGDETILLLVQRRGQDRYVAVRLERA